MFEWFYRTAESPSLGLERMRAEFGQMLDHGRHIFDAASNAFLGGTDLQVIRQDLFDTDKRINQAEQKIRREIVVHATVHGATSFPSCLVLMSVVKDAERVGDYAKNIFDLAEMTPRPPEGLHKEQLVRLKDRISSLMTSCREAFDNQDRKEGRLLIREAEAIEDECDRHITNIVRSQEPIDLGPTYVLAYRYFKRTASHVFNVATSIVQPIDKIDFSDDVDQLEDDE